MHLPVHVISLANDVTASQALSLDFMVLFCFSLQSDKTSLVPDTTWEDKKSTAC